MRIVILIPSLHAGAELALNKLLKRKDLQIVGIVRSELSLFSKKLWQYIRYAVKRTGIYYALLLGLFFNLHIIAIAIGAICFWTYKKRRWFTTDKLVQKYSIPLFNTTDINGKHARSFIRSLKPDVMVSIYFDQILKKSTMRLARINTINMHPGLLPRYRGLWAHFWTALHRKRNSGVTIHVMEEKIDSGAIIAQKRFLIMPRDTKWRLRLKAAVHGTALLIGVLQKMQAGVKIKLMRPKGLNRYYSMPSKEELDAFLKTGRRLFSYSDFKKALRNL